MALIRGGGGGGGGGGGQLIYIGLLLKCENFTGERFRATMALLLGLCAE